MRSTIVVLEGDQTGQELLEEALRVLDPDVTGLDCDFVRYDLSLEKRRTSNNQVVQEAARRIWAESTRRQSSPMRSSGG